MSLDLWFAGNKVRRYVGISRNRTGLTSLGRMEFKAANLGALCHASDLAGAAFDHNRSRGLVCLFHHFELAKSRLFHGERTPAAAMPAPSRNRLPGRAPPTIELETNDVGDRAAPVEAATAPSRRRRP